MGNSTFNNGHISSLLGSSLLLRNCVALLCEGGVFDEYDTDPLLNSFPQDKEDLDVNEMDVKRVYFTIWDICKLKRKYRYRSHLQL